MGKQEFRRKSGWVRFVFFFLGGGRRNEQALTSGIEGKVTPSE